MGMRAIVQLEDTTFAGEVLRWRNWLGRKGNAEMLAGVKMDRGRIWYV